MVIVGAKIIVASFKILKDMASLLNMYRKKCDDIVSLNDTPHEVS